MKKINVIAAPLVSLAVFGLCLPQSAWAAATTATAVQGQGVADVALANNGLLVGYVVDPQGTPLADVRVSLLTRDQQVATAKTDAEGRFAIGGLHGGVYQILVPQGAATYRLWAPGDAPPSAQQTALVVVAGTTVRGQECGRLRFFLSKPCVMAALVVGAAAAIAIPVAIHNNRTPASP
jgi:hypothetical protein